MDLNEVKKPPKIYSITEVAAFMEISKGTLYKLVRDGKINHVNIAKTGNRHIFGFTAQDVQSYYNSIPNSSHGAKRIDE